MVHGENGGAYKTGRGLVVVVVKGHPATSDKNNTQEREGWREREQT